MLGQPQSEGVAVLPSRAESSKRGWSSKGSSRLRLAQTLIQFLVHGEPQIECGVAKSC